MIKIENDIINKKSNKTRYEQIEENNGQIVIGQMRVKEVMGELCSSTFENPNEWHKEGKQVLNSGAHKKVAQK